MVEWFSLIFFTMILFFLASVISIRFGFSLSRPSFFGVDKNLLNDFWVTWHFLAFKTFPWSWMIREVVKDTAERTFFNSWNVFKSEWLFIVLPSTTISCLWFPEVLDNSERLLYLTRCHLLLRPRWMGSESHLMPFFVFEPNWHFLLWRLHRSSQD